ncbi:MULTISPECIES: hypothetical protein [unclassified Azospirillum]|uniref:hypothetical protein n=1 Tax=unclassified Azospirillum TaxID=2630922 RepID=UPI000B71CF43|nr:MULTISPECIES: hypothetical protein [unclassified Azospirillum]SNT11188.1 hypothetical protein SAMN05880556_12439 [Azospirillum sp. RU38E]SNT24219.1 hypothetical protein SAMN05880591_12339 [Azospirillum sp. RU37A]
MTVRDQARAWGLLALFELAAGGVAIARLGPGPGIIMALFLLGIGGTLLSWLYRGNRR